MRFEQRKHRVAPVSKDGAATDLGFTRDRHQMCASRVNPTCDVRDAAHESAESGRPEIAAPHHEAERDRVCIKLTANCFSVQEHRQPCQA